MMLNLNLSVQEINEILVGLECYQKEVKGLSEKIVAMANAQIAEINLKEQENQENNKEKEEREKED